MMNNTNTNIINFPADSSMSMRSEDLQQIIFEAAHSVALKMKAGELSKGDDDFIPALLEWLEDKVKSGSIKLNTFKKYWHYVNNTIAPFFNDWAENKGERLTIKSIKKKDVQKFINFCNTVKGSKPKTIRDMVGSVLKPFFNDMIDDYDAVPKNPCDRVKMPKLRTISEKKALTPDEQKRLAHALPRTNYMYISIPVLLYTGMRRSELLGLMWDDVDFENYVIHIHRTNVAVEGQKTEVKEETKTDASHRDIWMNPELENALLFHRKTVQHGKRKYVISQKTQDKPVDPNNFSRAFRRWCKKSGVDGSPHTLRHTYITNASNIGISAISLKQQTGHTDTRMIEYYTDNSKISDEVKRIQTQIGKYTADILA